MTTIDRYVAREFLRLYIVFIVSAPMLFVIGDWTEKIGDYSELGLPIGTVALGYLYKLPLFISWSMPVAALIATVFTVSAMSRHSEMTAAKAGGLSFYRVLRMLPVIGAAITLLGLAVTELVPITTTRSRQVLEPNQRTGEQMRHEFVYSGADGHVYTIRRLTNNGRAIGGLTIEHADARGNAPVLHISAREATWDSTSRGWTLHDGYYRDFTAAGGREQTFRFSSMQLRSFRETPEQLLVQAKEPEEMRYAELGAYIETIERSGGDPLDLRVELAQKIAIPVASFIIILFGAPLANTSARGGAAYGIGISLAITVAYMMMFRFAGAAGKAGMIDPVVAGWIPNVVVLAGAMGLLSRVRT